MSLINVSNLTFAYQGTYDNIFEHVSFSIDSSWKLGLIGRNGRGKTTFLSLLQQKYEYHGKITASVNFEYFPFKVSDKTVFTSEVLTHINPNYLSWQLLREFSQLKVDPEVLERPFTTLSNGEQTKILLAALFMKENSFLLIDEPTNHLDAEARELVCQYLKKQSGFILVSHDRHFLDRCIDHVLSINKATIEVQRGNFSTWQNNKQLQDSFELAENDKLKKDVVRLSAAAKRTAGWSDAVEKSKIGNHAADRGAIGHKAAKMMKRSKNTENRQQQAIEAKSKLLKNIETAQTLALVPLVHHSDRLLEMSHLSCFYGEKTVCADVSFTLNINDRIALQGKNGSGKTSLLKLMLGENIQFSGDLYKAGNLVYSYVSQDTSFLTGSLSAYANVCHVEESFFKSILRKLDFPRVQFEKDMSDFSEGQKKKVLIARSLSEKAHLYIWDEPLNFIDIFSRMQIEELLKNTPITLIFVEHDSAFTEEIATKHVYL